MTSLKFLLVEDSVQMRRLVRTLVDDLASDVIECAGGDEAVRMYFETKPDWVLMDVHMPGGDGLAATRAICARDRGARIVILTHFDDEALREEAASAGAVAYMLKEDLLRLHRYLTGEIERLAVHPTRINPTEGTSTRELS